MSKERENCCRLIIMTLCISMQCVRLDFFFFLFSSIKMRKKRFFFLFLNKSKQKWHQSECIQYVDKTIDFKTSQNEIKKKVICIDSRVNWIPLEKYFYFWWERETCFFFNFIINEQHFTSIFFPFSIYLMVITKRIIRFYFDSTSLRLMHYLRLNTVVYLYFSSWHIECNVVTTQFQWMFSFKIDLLQFGKRFLFFMFHNQRQFFYFLLSLLYFICCFIWSERFLSTNIYWTEILYKYANVYDTFHLYCLNHCCNCCSFNRHRQLESNRNQWWI